MLKNSSKKHGAFWPDYIANSVDKIDFEHLKRLGIKAVMIDLDGTVVEPKKFEVSKKVSEVLKSQGLKVYIATNRPKSRGLKNLKESLNANGVVHPKGLRGKPFVHYYKEALTILGYTSDQVAMIGDRYLQDIYGANKANFCTILVKKLGRPINKADALISNLENKRTNKIIRHYKIL